MNVVPRSLVIVFIAGCAWGQQRCLRDAWAAVERGDHRQAIASAERCIASSGTIAEAAQRRLLSSPEPEIGRISDEKIRNQVLANWAVNDVGAAYWIVGTESEMLYKTSRIIADLERAKGGYQDAIRFPHARVLDPQSDDCCFWSPAKDAKTRLEQLPKPITNSKRRP